MSTQSIQSRAGNLVSGDEGEALDQGAEAFDQGADEEIKVDQEPQEPAVQEQVGVGPLLLNHPLNPPAGFNIVTESETFYPNFGIHGRELEIQIDHQIRDGVEQILTHLLAQCQPGDQVAIIGIYINRVSRGLNYLLDAPTSWIRKW